jgi:hypothetical protein
MNLMEKYLKKGLNLNQPKPSCPRQNCQVLFERAVFEVGHASRRGTLRWVQDNQPELWAKMQELEDRINEFWLKSKTETIDMGTFKEAVEKWKSLHLRAIEFFSLVNRP